MQITAEMMALLERVLTLLALVVAAGLGVTPAWLRKKVRAMEGDSAAEQALLAALVEADKVARDAVLYARQVFVDTLKENTKDGKLTLSEAEHAVQVALSYFKRHMSENSLKVIAAAFGPVEKWVQELIEAKLVEVKLGEVPKAQSPASASR